jgi:hypothetical protein
MGLVAAASGTQIAQIGTEHQLSIQTGVGTVGIYVLVVDTNNMAAGDALTLRIKTKAIGGGTLRLAYTMTYADLQAEPNKYSVPVPSNNEIVASLEQTAGTARSFPWSLLRA